jgi:hypothetical protein
MQRGATLVQPKFTGGDWIWTDKRFCHYEHEHQSRASLGRAHFSCFFNKGDPCHLSAIEETTLMQDKSSRVVDTNDYSLGCPSYITDLPSRQKFRAASMEYLFSNMSRALVEAADAAAEEVFHYKDVPRDQLITIHVRCAV